MGILSEMFCGHLIRCEVISADLHIHLFKSEIFTSKVLGYIKYPQSIEQLKDAISLETTAIPHKVTYRVVDNLRQISREIGLDQYQTCIMNRFFIR